MLEQNMKEARLGEVDITDVDPDTLKKMLEFIYSGQVVNRMLKMLSLGRELLYNLYIYSFRSFPR